MNCSAGATILFEDLFAGSVTLLTSGVSLVVNSLTALCLTRQTQIQRQFATLCVSLAVADCGVLSVFLLWVTPVTLTRSFSWASSLLGRKMGQLSLFFWFASLYAMLAISVNRLVAITQFNRYEYWFNNGRTRLVVASTWVLGFVHSLLYFYPGCDFVYDPNFYLWYYVESQCQNLMVFMDLGYGILFIAVIFSLNVICGCKIRSYHKEILPSGLIEEEEVARRRRKEVKFFVQACVNAAVFEIMLLCFHVVARFLETKWPLFLSTSFIWLVSHGTNGFVLLAFNTELRDQFARFVCCLAPNEFGRAPPPTRAAKSRMVAAKISRSGPGISSAKSKYPRNKGLARVD